MTPYEELAIAIYQRAKEDHIKALIKIEKYEEKKRIDPENAGLGPYKAYDTCKEVIRFIHDDVYMEVNDAAWEKMVIQSAEKNLKRKLKYAKKYAQFSLIKE